MITLDPNEDQGEDGDAAAEPPAPTTSESISQPSESLPAPSETPTPMPWFLYSGFKEWCDPCDELLEGDYQLWTAWKIFASRQPENGDRKKLPPYDPWHDGDVVYGDDIDWSGSHYPIKVGPFKVPFKVGQGKDAGGYDDCYYSRKDDDERPGQPDTPGEIVCGGREGRCVDDLKGRSFERDADGKQIDGRHAHTWSPQAVCTLDGELPAPGDHELEIHPDPNWYHNQLCDGTIPDDDDFLTDPSIPPPRKQSQFST